MKLAKLQGARAPGGPEEPASVPAAQEEPASVPAPAAAPGEVIHWSAEAIPGTGPDAIAAVLARRAGKGRPSGAACAN